MSKESVFVLCLFFLPLLLKSSPVLLSPHPPQSRGVGQGHVHHGVPQRGASGEALPGGDHLQHQAGDPGPGGPEERAQLHPSQPAGDHPLPEEG